MKPTPRFVVLAVLLLVLLARSPAHAQTYTITDLSQPNGNATGGVYAINDNGQVVGTYSQSYSFIWSASTGFTNIPPMTDGTRMEFPVGINRSGQVVGSVDRGSEPHAALYSGGVLSVIERGELGIVGSFFRAINASGQAVGRAFFQSGSVYWSDPFIWSSGNGMRDLGSLSGQSGQYGQFGEAEAINDSGQVVGFSSLFPNDYKTYHAFLWTSGSGMKDLGTAGGAQSTAYGINSTGQVVGVSQTATGNYHAFRYSGGLMQDLGTLGNVDSVALGINNAGQIVGLSVAHDGVDHAFLYSDGNMRDLNDLIPAGSGWLLTEARAINNNGQIVGMGRHNDVPTSFLLTPSGSGGVKLASFTLNPPSVLGGQTVTGTVTLSGPAPVGGTLVTLTKASTLQGAVIPPSVTVASGMLSSSFQITTTAVTSSQSGDIAASYGGVSKSATLTVNGGGVSGVKLSALYAYPASIIGGQGSAGVIILSGPAPAGGAVVTLAKSPALKDATIPL